MSRARLTSKSSPDLLVFRTGWYLPIPWDWFQVFLLFRSISSTRRWQYRGPAYPGGAAQFYANLSQREY